MKACLAYFKNLILDPIFFRVCMLLWGMPFVALLGFAGFSWRPVDAYEWFGFGLVITLGLGGLFLIYIALFGSKKAIDKASNYMNEGGDIIGVIFALGVFLIALPVTAFIRGLRAPPSK